MRIYGPFSHKLKDKEIILSKNCFFDKNGVIYAEIELEDKDLMSSKIISEGQTEVRTSLKNCDVSSNVLMRVEERIYNYKNEKLKLNFVFINDVLNEIYSADEETTELLEGVE